MLKKFVLIFFICCSNMFSQEENILELFDTIALEEALEELEKKYEIRFSYDSGLIKEYQYALEKSETDLDKELENLRKQTSLIFEKLDKRYIVIRQKKLTKNNTVCGVVVDKQTKQPLEYVTVRIEEKPKGTFTDYKGSFELDGLDSNWTISVEYLGYKKERFKVDQLLSNSCASIQLLESQEALSEVLISDYLTKGLVKKKDGGVEISPNKLGILPGLTEPDVLQSLQLLPGIQSPDETASGMYIRGGTPDQNLVLFDGINMYQTGHFFGLISSINPYVIETVDVYRGGSRAKYGDRIGGVLDINTGDQIPTFKAGFGVNLTHADLFIKTPMLHNKVGLVFSARRSITDLVNTITYRKFSETVFQNTRILGGEEEMSANLTDISNTFFFHDYNLKLIADVTENDKLVFSNLYNKNQLNYSAYNERFGESISDQIGVNNKGYNLKWIKKLSTKLHQELAVHSSEYRYNYEGKREEEYDDPDDNVIEDFVKYNSVDDIGVNYGLESIVSENAGWNHGYQYTKSTVDYIYENDLRERGNPILEALAEVNNTHAFFTEYEYGKIKKVTINAGLRLNYFSAVNAFYLEPRLFIANQISNSFRINFSGEIKNQAVSQLVEFRNNGLGLENNIWAIADGMGIPVLESYQVSSGFLYQKEGWNLDVDFYYKNTDGLVLLTRDITTGGLPYISGVSKTLGMDFLLKKRIGNYRSWISYTLSKTKYLYEQLNSGDPFNGSYDIPHSLLWSHTYFLNKFEFSLGWRWRSGTPYTEATGIAIGNRGKEKIEYDSNTNAQRLPSYHKLDFSSTYKFSMSKNKKVQGKVGISLLNVFNQQNILSRSYELRIIREPRQVERKILVEVDRLSLGVTPNAVFRVSF